MPSSRHFVKDVCFASAEVLIIVTTWSYRGLKPLWLWKKIEFLPPNKRSKVLSLFGRAEERHQFKPPKSWRNKLLIVSNAWLGLEQSGRKDIVRHNITVLAVCLDSVECPKKILFSQKSRSLLWPLCKVEHFLCPKRLFAWEMKWNVKKFLIWDQ